MKLSEYPEKLKPYAFHGVEMSWDGDQDAIAECPFCGKNKFHISQATGMFHCKVCGEKGNIYTFINKYHEQCHEVTDIDALSVLAEERGVDVEVMDSWGVAWAYLNQEWIVPAYNEKGNMCNLYRYVEIEGKFRLLATSTLTHGIFGLNKFDPELPITYVCEGPWDGMAWDEVLARFIESPSGLRKLKQGESKQSLKAYANVISVPGCEVFRDTWCTLFEKSEEVRFLYDNDYPKINKRSGQKLAPASYRGMQRACGLLCRSEITGIRILQWGPNGHDPGKPEGYDVRDFIADKGLPKVIDNVLGLLVSPPESWVDPDNPDIAPSDLLVPEPCTNYETLIASWRKALKWTPSLDTTLAAMLATSASTKLQGDQLWLRVVGPPGTAKSTLCEALAVDKDNTHSISIQKGFHSGYKGSGAQKGKDSSLIPRIDGKTVITKDGDTLLNSSNRDQTLAEMRDFYDGTSRAEYKNFKRNNYTGLRITFILAGTRSLYKLNKSFLGDRFLDCIIYDRKSDYDPELEREVLDRAALNAFQRTRTESDGKADTSTDPALCEAMKLTAGYTQWLRANVVSWLSKLPEDPEVLNHCRQLGELVSYMRARQDREIEADEQEVELATRLTSQFVRLAMCLTVVLNKKEIDHDVMDRVVKVARDTSRGINLRIADVLYHATEEGMSAQRIALRLRCGDSTVRRALQFLREIEVVQAVSVPNRSGSRGRNKHKWTLTPNLRHIYESVMI